MYTVPYDDQRADLEQATLQHVGPPPGWAGRWLRGDRLISLWVAGDEQAPYGRLLALAQTLLPHLDELEHASDGYLREFVRYADNFYTGAWRVQSVRLTWAPGSRLPMGDEFELTLAVGDDEYGEWAVWFIRDDYPARAYRPYAFSRTQR